MLRLLVLFLLSASVGCSSFSETDSEWEIRAGEAMDSISVEAAPGDYICVREATDPPRRTCVPRVKEPDQPSGDS